MLASDPAPLTFFVLDVEAVEAGKVKGKGTAGAAKGKAPPSDRSDATDSVVMWGRARAGQPVCAVVPSSAFTSFFFFKAPDFVVVGDDDGDGDGGSSSGGNRRPFDPVRVRVRACRATNSWKERGCHRARPAVALCRDATLHGCHDIV